MKIFPSVLLSKLLTGAFLCALPFAAQAQISYQSGIYEQDFDDLISSGSGTVTGRGPHEMTGDNLGALDGWYFANPGGSSGNTEYRAQDGSQSGNAGRGVVSFGTTDSSDRALGTLATGNQISSFGVLFTNDSLETFTSITITYVGEQWRRGDVSSPNTLSFLYGISGTASINQAVTAVSQLNFVAPNTETEVGSTNIALDGNDAANQTNVEYTITGLTWAPGQILALRWNGEDQSGQDDGLAIDNFTFTALAPPPDAANVVWNQAGSGIWDASTANWTGGIPSDTTYKDGDFVTFSNAGGGTIEVAPGGVVPGSVIFNSAGDYILEGGSVGGTGALTKEGEGSLTLTAANSYEGGTQVNEGELLFSNDDQLGVATGALGINGGRVTTTAEISSTRSIVVGSEGAAFDTNGHDSSFGTLSGNGEFNKEGEGLLTVSGYSHTGPVNIEADGALRVDTNTTFTMSLDGDFAGDIEVAGTGRLTFASSGSFDGGGRLILVDSGTSFAVRTAVSVEVNKEIVLNPNDVDDFIAYLGAYSDDPTVTYNNDISGRGTVRFSGAGGNYAVGGASLILLNYQFTYDGDTELNLGNSASVRLLLDDALNTEGGLRLAPTPDGRGTFDLNGFDQTLAFIELEASNFAGRSGIYNTGRDIDDNPILSTLTLNQDVDTEFFGIIGGSDVGNVVRVEDRHQQIRLIKNGDGHLTLGNNANTYEGGTVINGGAIVAASASALGNGDVIVNSGSLIIRENVAFSPGVGNQVILASESAVYLKGLLFDGFEAENFANFGSVSGQFTPGGSVTTVSLLAGEGDGFGGFEAQLTFTDVNPALGGLAPEGLIANLTGLNGQVFAMQLTLDVPVSEGWMLGWFDPFAGQWTNAVDGNVLDPDFEYLYAGYAGNVAFNDFLADIGEGFGDSYLGAWGIDSSSNSVWAVLNHNSSFAVLNAIPEPSTAMLFGLGAGLWALRRRRR